MALPKNERSRIVAIPGVLVDELSRHLQEVVKASPESSVFLGERWGTPRRGNWRVVSKWRSALDLAGLPVGFHFHDHRQPPCGPDRGIHRELMQRMGHSTVRAAMIYQHATDARSRHLADRLDALIKQEMGDVMNKKCRTSEWLDSRSDPSERAGSRPSIRQSNIL
ncbi:MAG: integrase [Tetrasphaera sp.]|nr:integrase [Tetrasphaera sp.]